jgi:hypothetical protein
MAVDVRTLFKIVGEEGPVLRRVEEAMEWLLSPKAEGIGQKLLHDAHELHGKPITIIASTVEQNGYYAEGHLAKINPNHLAAITLKAADGTSHAFSVERSLAHELTHAGQREATAEAEHALEAINERAQAAAIAHLDKQALIEQASHLIKANEAPDYHTARQHIADYVDQVALPQHAEVMRHIHNDPEFIRYVTTMEPAPVAIENRVAALRGEPLRTDYTTAHEIAPEALREIMIDEFSNQLGIHQKPRLEAQALQRTDGQSWTASLGARSGRSLGE